MALRIAFALLAAVGALELTLPSAPRQDVMGPFVQDEPRALARVAYFAKDGAIEYAIEYGKPTWKSEWDAEFAKFRGTRVRLGKDWWTTLDSTCELTIGGKKLEAGRYFLALDCSAKGEWSLVALDAKSILDQRVDAFGTKDTTGGQNLPMKLEEAKESAKELAIKLVKDAKDTHQQMLEIHFGKHRLTAVVQPKV